MSFDPSNPPAWVLLVAPDEPGLRALDAAGEILDEFSIRWEPLLFPPCSPFPGVPRGCRTIIAASDSAELPAALAGRTGLPVIRVPVAGGALEGLPLIFGKDANLPACRPGEPAFATVAIGAAGAKNAALFAVSALALTDERVRGAWHAFRARQTDVVLRHPALTLED